MRGRYGPYVTDGKINATLPRTSDPMTVSLTEAKELIEARAAKGPAASPRRGKRAVKTNGGEPGKARPKAAAGSKKTKRKREAGPPASG
jgi:DNA topoisomerase-1